MQHTASGFFLEVRWVAKGMRGISEREHCGVGLGKRGTSWESLPKASLTTGGKRNDETRKK